MNRKNSSIHNGQFNGNSQQMYNQKICRMPVNKGIKFKNIQNEYVSETKSDRIYKINRKKK